MKEDQFDRKIAEQLQRLSIPDPDPDFTDRVYHQFMQQVQRKQKLVHVMRRGWIWASSFAIIGIFVLLFWQNDFYQFLQQAKDNRVLMPSDHPNTEEIDATIEIKNYFYDENVPWRFYVNDKQNELYMGLEGKEPILIHSVKNGYVNANIYPNPTNPSEVLFIVWENQSNEIDYQYYYFVDAQGTLTKIPFLPEYGYSSSSIHWSPNGEKAVALLNNAMYRNILLVLFDVHTMKYTHLYGNAEPYSDPRRSEEALGWTRLSLVTWVTDQMIVLLDNDRDTFYTFTTTDNWNNSHTMETFQTKGADFKARDLYPLPEYETVIVKTGNIRIDVGFEPSYRLFTFSPKNGHFSELKTVYATNDAQYEQNLLFITEDGDPIISTMIRKGEEYELIIQQAHPINHISIKEFTVNPPYVLTNPRVYPSPSGKRLALQYLGWYYEPSDEYVYSTRVRFIDYFVFLDLETDEIIAYETEEYDEIEWLDDKRVQYGNAIFDFDELNR